MRRPPTPSTPHTSPLSRLTSFLTSPSRRVDPTAEHESPTPSLDQEVGFILRLDPALPSLGLELDFGRDVSTARLPDNTAAYPIPAQRPLSLVPVSERHGHSTLCNQPQQRQRALFDSREPAEGPAGLVPAPPPRHPQRRPGTAGAAPVNRELVPVSLEAQHGTRAATATVEPVLVPLHSESSGRTGRARPGTARRNSIHKLKEWANRSMPELSVLVGVKGYIEDDPPDSRELRRPSTSRHLVTQTTPRTGREPPYAPTPHAGQADSLTVDGPRQEPAPEPPVAERGRTREIRFGIGPMTYLYPGPHPGLTQTQTRRPSAASIIRDTYVAQQLQIAQRRDFEVSSTGRSATGPAGGARADTQADTVSASGEVREAWFRDARLIRDVDRSPDLSRAGRAQRRSASFDAGVVLRLTTDAPLARYIESMRLHEDDRIEALIYPGAPGSPMSCTGSRRAPHIGETGAQYTVSESRRQQSQRELTPSVDGVDVPPVKHRRHSSIPNDMSMTPLGIDQVASSPIAASPCSAVISDGVVCIDAEPSTTNGALYRAGFEPISLVTSFVTSPLLYTPPSTDLTLPGHPFQSTPDLPPPQRLAVIRAQMAHFVLYADVLLAARARLYAQNELTLKLLEILPRATAPPDGASRVEKTQRILDHGVPMSYTLAIEEKIQEWWDTQREELNSHWSTVNAELDRLTAVHAALLEDVTLAERNTVTQQEKTWIEDAKTIGLATRAAQWAADAVAQTPVDEAFLFDMAAKVERLDRIPHGSSERFYQLARAAEAEVNGQISGGRPGDSPDSTGPEGAPLDRVMLALQEVLGISARPPRTAIETPPSGLIVLGGIDHGAAGAISPSKREARQQRRDAQKAAKRREAFREGRMAAEPTGRDLDLIGRDYPDGDVPAGPGVSTGRQEGQGTQGAVRRLLSRSSGSGNDSGSSGEQGNIALHGRPRTPLGPRIMDLLRPRPRPSATRPRLIPFHEEVDCMITQADDHTRFPWPCPGPIPERHREVFSPAPSMPRNRPLTPGPDAAVSLVGVDAAPVISAEPRRGRASVFGAQAGGPALGGPAVDRFLSLRATAPTPGSMGRKGLGLWQTVVDRAGTSSPTPSALSQHLAAHQRVHRSRSRRADAIGRWRSGVQEVEGTDAWDAESSAAGASRPATPGGFGAEVARRFGLGVGA